MVGKKFYNPLARVRVPLPAQCHPDPDGDRYPDRDLARIGNHCHCRVPACHRLAHLEISAGHWKMVRKRSGL